MDPHLRHSIFPDAQKATYADGGVENIDWTLVIPEGRMYVPNSTWISGEVKFLSDNSDENSTYANTDKVAFDGSIGMHALFRSMTISTDMGGTLPVQDEYPGWAKQVAVRKKNQEDLCSSAIDNLALCLPANDMTRFYISPESAGAYRSWAFKPLVPLNMMSTDSMLDNRLGDIHFGVTTNDVLSILYGASVTASGGYRIKNLKLHYETVPRDNSLPRRAVMSVVAHAKHTVASSLDTMSINLPLVASRFCGYYVPTANVKQSTKNEYQFHNPEISRLEFSYNDQTNRVVTYPMRSQEEILLNGMCALGECDKTLINNPRLEQREGEDSDYFVIGADLGTVSLDLRTQRLGIRTESAITSAGKFFLNVYAVGEKAL